MNVIKLSIPMEYHALVRASEMLKNLSDDLNPVFTKEEIFEPLEVVRVADETSGAEADPKVIFMRTDEAPIFGTSDEVEESSAQPRLDSEGLPWDERIHASSRGKMKSDNTWKRKRGVGDSVYEGVVLELRAAMSAKAGQPYVAPSPTPEPVTVPSEPVADVQLVTKVGMIEDFPTFVQACTAAQLPADQILAALNKHGLPALVMLATRPDLIPAVAAELF